MRVVVLGGGVIGTSIAWRLAARGADVTRVERTAIACAASGRSGGFLAKDWCDGTPLMHLARRSFDLHAELAEELEGDWGYRRLTTYAGVGGPADNPRAAWSVAWVDFVRSGDQRPARLRRHDGAGQPRRLHDRHDARRAGARGRAAAGNGHGTAAPRRRCGRRGSGRRVGRSRCGRHRDGAVVGARGTLALVAAGVGFERAQHRLRDRSDRSRRKPCSSSSRRPPARCSHRRFSRDQMGRLTCVRFRANSPLPVDPASVVPDDGAIDRLKALCERISPVLAGSRVLTSGACYRPMTRDGLPLIGAVPGARGVYVATGHSVWGILNAPATAEAIAELILDGAAREIDLAPFDPARLRRLILLALVTL